MTGKPVTVLPPVHEIPTYVLCATLCLHPHHTPVHYWRNSLSKVYLEVTRVRDQGWHNSLRVLCLYQVHQQLWKWRQWCIVVLQKSTHGQSTLQFTKQGREYCKSGNVRYLNFSLEKFSCWKFFVGSTSYENILTRKFYNIVFEVA